MIFFYRVLSIFFYPLLIILIFVRRFLKKEHPIRYKEKIFSSNFNIKKNKNLKLIWFHAASIGELKSILPIIHALKKKDGLEFLITTVTLSSSDLASKIFKNDKNIFHRFFPLDSFFLMKTFLNSWKPNTIFLVDSEIWPNLIYLSKKSNISLSIINARITEKTFKRWKLFPKTAKKIFSSFDLCLASNNESKDYLLNFNANNVEYFGNIKFLSKIETIKTQNPNEKFLDENNFWCAISTHKNEEKFCLEVHLKLMEKIKNLKIILAPRHISRVYEIEKLCERLKLSSQILNNDEIISDSKDVIIINSFGNLNEFLVYAKSVFIGKSLIHKLKDDGGQNPIEPAKLGCKIYHGPYVYNFQEIYQILKINNISKKIHDKDSLAKNLEIDLEKSNTKNSEKFSKLFNNLENDILNATMKKIDNFLLNENS